MILLSAPALPTASQLVGLYILCAHDLTLNLACAAPLRSWQGVWEEVGEQLWEDGCHRSGGVSGHCSGGARDRDSSDIVRDRGWG